MARGLVKVIKNRASIELPLGGVHLAVLFGADADVPRR